MHIFGQVSLALVQIVLILVIVKYIVKDVKFLYQKAKVLREEEPIYYRVSDTQLDEKIKYIQEQIRQKRINFWASVYTVPEDIRKELERNRFSLEALQRLVDSIVSHTGVFNSVKVVINDDVPENTAGLYTIYGRIVREVHLYRNNKYSVQQIIAIIVHECIHNFLNYYELELPSQEENEILTDVTAVYLGFGQLLLEGYKPVKVVDKSRYEFNEHGLNVHKWRIGYLKLPDLVYLIRKINL